MKPFFFLLILILLPGPILTAQTELPAGKHPPALEFPYFPNKAYAVIWRNWNLVPVSRMAKTLECTEEEILETGYSMGLPETRPVPQGYDQQMYITVIRRNWHLLPYDQLLTLLDMEAEELAFALKEDDFLYVKLGNLKPDCKSVKYRPPTDSEKVRAAEIKKAMTRYFPGKETKAEPPLAFIGDLKKAPAGQNIPSNEEGLRFIYSYFGVFGDPLMNPELDPYPEGLLAGLARHGVNGVWLHVVLHQLIPEGGLFPELGKDSEIRLKNLQDLVDRAARYGIRIYLYINEPRAMPDEFFENRPEIAGVSQNGYTTLCTGTEEVSRWLSDGLAHVFRAVHGLGGVFTITASENLTSCASHNLQSRCVRCSKRSYAEIIAGVNRSIAEGVHSADSEAKVIVWDWGWNGHGDGREIIEKLPADVWLMSVSEWTAPFSRGGVDGKVGEYSVSVPGPGPRAQMHWKAAGERGLKTVAKVQFNNSWELAAVPWIPVPDLVAEHNQNLAQAGLDGYMLSWSLGGYPSPNLEIAHRFSQDPSLSADQVLNDIARDRYGQQAAGPVRQAWTAFSEAFRQFPYDIRVMYYAPQQYGPANLLFPHPTGYAASMVGFPYDDLDGWRGPYSRDALITQFEKLTEKWEEGLLVFREALQIVDDEKKQTAEADFRLAEAAYLHFVSVASQSRYVKNRDLYLERRDPVLKGKILADLDRELETAVALWKVARHDSRIGFEASNQYFYVPQDLMEKVLNVRYLKTWFAQSN